MGRLVHIIVFRAEEASPATSCMSKTRKRVAWSSGLRCPPATIMRMSSLPHLDASCWPSSHSTPLAATASPSHAHMTAPNASMLHVLCLGVVRRGSGLRVSVTGWQQSSNALATFWQTMAMRQCSGNLAMSWQQAGNRLAIWQLAGDRLATWQRAGNRLAMS